MSNPPSDRQALIDRLAADIHELNPDYRDFEGEVVKLVTAFLDLLPAAQPPVQQAEHASFCVYCSTVTTWPSADEMRAGMVEHGLTCEKRPERRLFDKLDELATLLQRIRASAMLKSTNGAGWKAAIDQALTLDWPPSPASADEAAGTRTADPGTGTE